MREETRAALQTMTAEEVMQGLAKVLEDQAGVLASQLIDQARTQSGVGGIDLMLAEKVIGAGLNTRRAVTIPAPSGSRSGPPVSG